MMISTTLVSLALAATTLASPTLVARQNSHVLVNTEPFGSNPPGREENLEVTIGVCFNSTQFPAGFDNQISAISPNDILNCALHDSNNCSDTNPRVITGRVNNLADIGWDNRISSLLCTCKNAGCTA